MKAVAADPELHSGHPLAFMAATAGLPNRQGMGLGESLGVARNIGYGPGRAVSAVPRGGISSQAWGHDPAVRGGTSDGTGGGARRRQFALGGSLPALPNPNPPSGTLYDEFRIAEGRGSPDSGVYGGLPTRSQAMLEPLNRRTSPGSPSYSRK